MQQNTLVLQPAHTTAHTIAYSGDLRQLVSHYNGGVTYLPHDFIDTQKLRAFLVRNGAISGEEYSFDYGTNGTRFWQFHPDLAEHKKIIEKRMISCFIGERMLIHSPYNPANQSGDECSLVRDAFVGTPISLKDTYKIKYIHTSPVNFTPESVLLISARLQTTPNLFQNYAGGRYAFSEVNEHINAVLTDLRNKLFEKADESIIVHFNLGYGFYLGNEGVTLRTDFHHDYAWAQSHLVPTLKTILDNSDFGDAVVIRQELARIPLPSSHTDNNMRKLILDARRESSQKIIDDNIKNNYNSAVEKALKELEKNKDVVQALKLM